MAARTLQPEIPPPSPQYILEDQERMTKAKNYFAWQSRLVTRALGRRVVEVGCGLGNFTGMLLDREAVLAIDAEPGCIERLRERYPRQPNLASEVCDVSSHAFAGFAGFAADSCVCLNVLEHVRDDRHALRQMGAVLVPGGCVVLIIPAFPALYGPIDRCLGHYRRYTRRSLGALAESAGLHLESARYMNFVGFFGWWANSHIFRREAQSNRQVEIFDRFLVPVMSRLEDRLPLPFGQSLLVVLRKTT